MPAMLNRISRAMMRCYPFANGQGRVIDRSYMGRLRFAEPTLRVRCAGGYGMEVMPNDHIGRHVYLTGQFDGAIVSALRSFCRRGDERILDIGANVGSVSCALLHALPNCRLAAVEPQPAIHALLARNLAEVGGGRGVALEVAVSDHDGIGEMAVPDGHSASSHLIQVDGADAAGPNVPRVGVKVVSGERLFEMSGLDRLDVVKIDVEGFEETVIRALAGTFREHRPRAVLFEHFGELDRAEQPIRAIFESCGYRLFGMKKTLFGFEWVPVDELARRAIRTHDYVAKRESDHGVETGAGNGIESD